MPKPPSFKPPASKKTLRPTGKPAPLVTRAPEAAPAAVAPPPAPAPAPDALAVQLRPGQLPALEAACRARGLTLDALVADMVDDWLHEKPGSHANAAETPARALATAARERVRSLLHQAYDRLARMQQQSRTVRRLTAWVPNPRRE